MDLYSPKAIELHAEVLKARADMLQASEKYNHAKDIARDGEFRSADGTHGQHNAAQIYQLSVREYQRALSAWARHVLDS